MARPRPTTGERLATHPARKLPGFDLTFRAPKSASLLWALADDRVAEQVREAHDAAVAAAVGYLEWEAGWTRRGAQGWEAVRVEGFVAAAFRHRTSRAGDPLLHTHALVANLGRAVDDGIWRTLDSRRIYAHAKTAGTLYQAHLRHELTARLGVAFDPVTNGYAALAGVPREWIDAFSQRRAEIVAHMDERGEHSAKAAQVATLATRTAKEAQPSERELRQRWAERARELGVDPGWWRQLLGRHTPEPVDVAGLYRELVVDEALTQGSSGRAPPTLRLGRRLVVPTGRLFGFPGFSAGLADGVRPGAGLTGSARRYPQAVDARNGRRGPAASRSPSEDRAPIRTGGRRWHRSPTRG